MNATDHGGIPGEDQEKIRLKSVLLLMHQYDPDHPHAIQVGKLAVGLFSDLAPLHTLGNVERELLCYAALLHDIGWSVPKIPHHKASMNLILSDLTTQVTNDERRIIALIARYHRKAHPSVDHRIFCLLSEEQKNQVRWSAAILRIADMLDRTHDSCVLEAQAHISVDKITICCVLSGKERRYEGLDSVFLKKSALLGEMTGKEIEVSWN